MTSDVTTIGFIGSGNMGGTVARLAVAVGYDVVLSNSREPQTLGDAVTRFLDAIGYDTVDAGALGSGGRRFEVGSRAWVAPYGALTNERGTPAPVAAIRIALGL